MQHERPADRAEAEVRALERCGRREADRRHLWIPADLDDDRLKFQEDIAREATQALQASIP